MTQDILIKSKQQKYDFATERLNSSNKRMNLVTEIEEYMSAQKNILVYFDSRAKIVE